MGMFSITVKFKCKSCESIFEYVDQFIGHKKEKHLKEFQKLKCILFEEKTETTTDRHRDEKHELISNEGSFPVHQELIDPDSDSTGIADNNAEIKQASSWGHQNLILYTSDNITADSYSLNLLNSENLIQQADSHETDPVADSIKQESELEIEIELDADSESQFDYFLGDQSTSSSHEELSTPLSSVEIKYRAKNTSSKSISSTTSTNKNESDLNSISNPYVLIRRLASKAIQTTTTSSTSTSNVNTINYIADARKLENPGQPPSRKIRRTETGNSSHTSVTKPFSCDICDASFSRKGILSNHLLTHSDLRPFKCKFPNCTSSFKAKRNLDQHQVSHSEERPFHCKFPGCNKSSKSRESFRSHVRTHKEERPYTCSHPYCNRSFKLEGSLEQHISSIHGQINESSIVDSVMSSYTCDICSLEFPAKSHLNRHIAVHSDLKPFKCTFLNCLSRFKLKRFLDQHELSHSDVRPFKCTYPGCSIACKYPQNLQKHLRTHTDDRPFKCSIGNCDRTFRHPESVKAHIVACHIENEEVLKLNIPVNYICDIKGCTKKFYKKQAYDKHYRSHKKEVDSLLKCPHPGCNSDFTRAELTLHMRRVHKGQRGSTSTNTLPPHVILVQSAASPPE